MTVQEASLSDTIPWNDLVRGCVAGDEEAWNRLIESAWPMVHGWLVRTCRNPVLADDLAQTVFLRLGVST
jgi:DNA-directed RNA polymerase specialized sigma24 family protein